MKRKQSAFSLIELLIAIAIVGILARVAFPYYKIYRARSMLSEVIEATDGCKVTITHGLQTLAAMPTDWNQWGCEIPSGYGSEYIQATVTDQFGGIGVYINNTGYTDIDGTWMTLTPTNSTGTQTPTLGTVPYQWLCGNQIQVGVSMVGRTTPLQYLPAACRG